MVPMAVSLGFGVLFATFITLILLPATYVILDDLQLMTRAIFGLLQPDAGTAAAGAVPDERNSRL